MEKADIERLQAQMQRTQRCFESLLNTVEAVENDGRSPTDSDAVASDQANVQSCLEKLERDAEDVLERSGGIVREERWDPPQDAFTVDYDETADEVIVECVSDSSVSADNVTIYYNDSEYSEQFTNSIETGDSIVATSPAPDDEVSVEWGSVRDRTPDVSLPASDKAPMSADSRMGLPEPTSNEYNTRTFTSSYYHIEE